MIVGAGRVPSKRSLLLHYHTLRASSDLRGARQVLSKAVHQHPCSSSLWNALGVALLEDVKTTEAKMRKAAIKQAKKKKKKVSDKRVLVSREIIVLFLSFCLHDSSLSQFLPICLSQFLPICLPIFPNLSSPFTSQSWNELPSHCSVMERSLRQRGISTDSTASSASRVDGSAGKQVHQAAMVGATEPDRQRLEEEKASLLLQGYSELSCAMSGAMGGAGTQNAQGNEQTQEDEKKEGDEEGEGRVQAAAAQLLAAKKLLHIDPTEAQSWRLAALAEINARQICENSQVGPAVATYLQMHVAS